jgi:hypothetical protein
VIVAPSRTVLEPYVLPTFARFLAERGRRLSEAKTHIVHRTEGFNFRGCEIRRFPRALLTQPQKTKMRGHYRAITTYLLYSRAGRSTHHGDCRVVFGLMSGHVLVWYIGWKVHAASALAIRPSVVLAEWGMGAAVLVLAATAGLLPAVQAYRQAVASYLGSRRGAASATWGCES